MARRARSSDGVDPVALALFVLVLVLLWAVGRAVATLVLGWPLDRSSDLDLALDLFLGIDR